MIREVRNWITTNLMIRELKLTTELWRLYMIFQAHFSMAMEDRGFKKQDIDGMPVVEFIRHIKDWAKVN